MVRQSLSFFNVRSYFFDYLGDASRVGVRAIDKECVVPPNAVKDEGNQRETVFFGKIGIDRIEYLFVGLAVPIIRDCRRKQDCDAVRLQSGNNFLKVRTYRRRVDPTPHVVDAELDNCKIDSPGR